MKKPATGTVFPGTPVSFVGGGTVFPGTPVIFSGGGPGPKKKKPPGKPKPAPAAVFPGTPVVFVGPGPKPKPKVKPKRKVVRKLGPLPCVAVAVGRVLGLRADQVLPYCGEDGDVIGDVLEALEADGLCGEFWPAEPDLAMPGLIVGLTLAEGTHAAVTAGDGLMWSWGLAMPVLGRVDEAWWAVPALEANMQSQKSDPLAFQRVWDKMQGGQASQLSPAQALTRAYLAQQGADTGDSGGDDADA